MNLVASFLRRRWWILSHHWMSELALTLLLPVAVYVSVVPGLSNLLPASPEGIQFQDWVVPGLVFIIAFFAAYFPVFSEIFEKRRIHPYLESVAASPNSRLSVVSSFVISLIPEVILKSFAAVLILQLLGGSSLSVLPFIGFMFFVLVFSLLIVNVAFTVTLVTSGTVLNLLLAFLIFVFVVFSSGWIIPVESFPPTLSSILSALPTAQLIEGGRLLLFEGQLSLFTWLIPMVVAVLWLGLNSILFRKITTL